MLYEIILRNAEFNFVLDLAKQNGFADKILEIFTCRDDTGDFITFFKCNKETLEKIMFFMPEGYLKQKLQGKIDFWYMNGMW